MLGETRGHRRGRREPERATAQLWCGGDEMCGQLAGEGMDDKTWIARGEVARDLGVFFLVATNIAHRRQAAGDGVSTGRNRLTEGKVDENRHDARGQSVSIRGGLAIGTCEMEHRGAH